MHNSAPKNWNNFDLFNQVPVNIAVIDDTYRIVDSNALFVENFGQWNGKKCFHVYKNSNRVCKDCQASETFKDGKVRDSIEGVRDRKGNFRQYLVRISPYRDAEGKITHVIEMSTDITEQVRVNKQYQTIFDNVPCYIAVIDRDFKIVTANKNFQKTFGHETDTFCFESFKKRKTVCEECPARRVFKDGKAHNSLQQGCDKRGNNVIYMVTASPYSREGKQVDYVIEMALDVTKTFFLEEKLKKSLQFQKVIVENAIDGIIASDEDGYITTYNPSAKSLLKYSARQIVGKKHLEEISPRDFLAALKAGLTPIELKESKMTDRNGNEIPVVLSGTTLEKDGENIGTVMFFQDLSKIKHLEHGMLEAERLAAVGQTVAGLSHGIKNILMGLEGGMYVVNSGLKREDNDLVKQGWDMLQNNISKVSSFVKEFLGFAKGTVPHVELINPFEIATEIVNLYKDSAQQAGIVFVPKLQKNIDPASNGSAGYTHVYREPCLECN